MPKPVKQPKKLRTLDPRTLAAVAGGVMKTRHDTIKNSIGNIR